jgi:hypothetical protein
MWPTPATAAIAAASESPKSMFANMPMLLLANKRLLGQNFPTVGQNFPRIAVFWWMKAIASG